MEEVIKKKRGRKPLNKVVKTEEVKVLKKRGRKPKIKDESEIIEPKELKKRGRKPKPKHPEELLPKVPKKRGRKPKDKYGFFQKNEINKLTNHLNDNIILHLPIHSLDLGTNEFDEQSLLKYNPNINTPVPYEPALDDKFMDLSPYPFDEKDRETQRRNEHEHEHEHEGEYEDEHEDDYEDKDVNEDNKEEELEVEDTEEIFSDTPGTKNIISKKTPLSNVSDEKEDEEYYLNHDLKMLKENLNSVKVNFQEVSLEMNNTKISNVSNNNFTKLNSVHSETNINCWWCCHEFTNTPFVLPTKKVNNCINAIGCFCCAECATSWNFYSDKRNDDIWESYSLLNLLYRKYLNGNILKIKFAPPRESLIKFGGSLTIEDFRSFNNSYNKKIQKICHPVVSLVPQMEEVFMNVSDKCHNYIPVDVNRIKKVNNDLKLKRSRPVTDPVNTLESCMNLKYI